MEVCDFQSTTKGKCTLIITLLGRLFNHGINKHNKWSIYWTTNLCYLFRTLFHIPYLTVTFFQKAWVHVIYEHTTKGNTNIGLGEGISITMQTGSYSGFFYQL